MGGKLAVGLVAAVLSAGLAGTPASAVPTRDLYMVKDVGYSGNVYYGDFVAVRKSGKKVVGAVGAFSSEYFCVKGRVSKGRLKGREYNANGEPGDRFSVKWRGTGAGQHIKGWRPISKATFRTYLQGDSPTRMINVCVRMV
ncbi:MAG TPA: hypothetical protein PLT68_13035 [Actinomycetota bacterium]|nr:hypothetical protein [Actinomycetota bacterium]